MTLPTVLYPKRMVDELGTSEANSDSNILVTQNSNYNQLFTSKLSIRFVSPIRCETRFNRDKLTVKYNRSLI